MAEPAQPRPGPGSVEERRAAVTRAEPLAGLRWGAGSAVPDPERGDGTAAAAGMRPRGRRNAEGLLCGWFVWGICCTGVSLGRSEGALCLFTFLIWKLNKASHLDDRFQQFPDQTAIIHCGNPMDGVRPKAEIEAEVVSPKFCAYKFSRKLRLVVKCILRFFPNGILKTPRILPRQWISFVSPCCNELLAQACLPSPSRRRRGANAARCRARVGTRSPRPGFRRGAAAGGVQPAAPAGTFPCGRAPRQRNRRASVSRRRFPRVLPTISSQKGPFGVCLGPRRRLKARLLVLGAVWLRQDGALQTQFCCK